MSPAEGIDFDMAYIYKRNRIFAEALDAESDDLLLNLSYNSPVGKLKDHTDTERTCE